MKFPTLKAAAVAAIMLSGNAFAGDQSVSVTDLDLDNRTDAAVLYTRIQQAARRLCNDEISPWDGQKIKTRDRCIANAVNNAVEQINKPQLTAVHRIEEERVASL